MPAQGVKEAPGGSLRAALNPDGRRELTEDEKKIEAFIRKKGVTECPPCFSEELKMRGIQAAAVPVVLNTWRRVKAKSTQAPAREITSRSKGRGNDWDVKHRELRRLALGGMTDGDLALHFGVSKERIGQIRNKYDIPKTSEKGFSDEDIALMFELRSKGWTYDEIGERFGRTGSNISNLLRNELGSDAAEVFRPKVLVKNPRWDFSDKNLI